MLKTSTTAYPIWRLPTLYWLWAASSAGQSIVVTTSQQPGLNRDFLWIQPLKALKLLCLTVVSKKVTAEGDRVTAWVTACHSRCHLYKALYMRAIEKR